MECFIMENKYTATLYCNDTKMTSRSGDNFNKIRISLLTLLEDSVSGAYGLIVDNDQGTIIRRFRKAVID